MVDYICGLSFIVAKKPKWAYFCYRFVSTYSMCNVFTENFYAKDFSVAIFRIYQKKFRITEKMFITLAPEFLIKVGMYLVWYLREI